MLDTNALIWALGSEERFDAGARAAIADPDNEVLVSLVSLWEIVIKVRVGKLKIDLDEVEDAITNLGFDRLTIKSRHLKALVALPRHHGDPFDHLLIAQAISEEATMVSSDEMMRAYPVRLYRSDTE